MVKTNKGWNIAGNLVMVLLSFLALAPFLLLIIASLTDENVAMTFGYSYFPQKWSLSAYQYIATQSARLGRAYMMTIIVTAVGTTVGVMITALLGYMLSNRELPGRKFFNFYVVFTMLFNGGLVPTYVICTQVLGLTENYAALIVPLLVSPFNIIIMRTFFKSSVPLELIEAATIDGSGEYATFFRVVLPIAKPGLAPIALLNALAYWNDWYLSLLYIKQNKVLQPLQALLMELQNNVEYLNRMSAALGSSAIQEAMRAPTQTLRMVLVVLIVVPIACAYPFFQRYIVAGLTIGSVKG